MNKTILLCCFRYPPYSRVGAYRWAKLSRKLADQGHTLHVCSVAWPAMEATDWLADVQHPRIIVHRSPSGYFQRLKYTQVGYRPVREFRNVLIGRVERVLGLDDEARFWGPFLLPQARRIIQAQRPEVIIATGAPFSVNYWAARIKREFPQLKLVQDFRDPWEPTSHRESRWRALALECADAVVAVTPEMTAFFKSIGAQRAVQISNGFDPASLRGISRPPAALFDFVHIGTVFNDRIAPLSRFLAWVRARASSGRPLKVALVGRFPGKISQDYADLVRQGALLLRPQVGQTEALQSVADSRFALQLNAPAASTQVSTKIFEYGALGVPTLSLNYGGAIDKLVREHDLGWSIDANAADFDARLDACVDSEVPKFAYDVAAYAFESLARQYSELLATL
jgi:glycosyltransferase involved in cell wall biosynthesis